jgi:hypothetical protein
MTNGAQDMTQVMPNGAAAGETKTAQLHVSFISKQVAYLVSEETIRSLFSSFGKVVDVVLKKATFDQVS